MFFRELTKLCSKRTFIFLLILIFCMNGVLLYLSETEKLTSVQAKPDSYHALWENIQSYPIEEAYICISQKFDLLYLVEDIDLRERFESWNDEPWVDIGIEEEAYKEALLLYQSGDYLTYTSSLHEEIVLYREVLQELENGIGYSQYLSDVKEKTLSRLDKLKDDTGFTYNNLKNTYQAYEKMTDVKIDTGPSRGIRLVLENRITDLFALLFIMLVVLIEVTSEREKNLLILVKSAKEGRVRLGVCKLLLVYMACLFIMLLHIQNLIIASELYGLGDLGRSIQSVSGYQSCTLKLTVRGFFAINIILRWLFYCMCASGMYMISCVLKKSVYVVSGIALITGVSFAIYENISNTSNMLVLKQLTLMGLIRTEELLGTYRNIRLGEMAADRLWLCLGEMILMLSVFSIVSVIGFAVIREKESQKNTLFIRIRKHLNMYPGSHTCSFFHECVKTLITSRALFILIVSACIYILTFTPIFGDNDVQTLFYREMISEVCGRAENIDETYWEKLHEDYDILYMNAAEAGDIERLNSIQYALQVIDRLESHAAYLAGKEKSWYLDSAGYELLTGADEQYIQYDLRIALYVAVVSSIAFIAVFGLDYQHNEVRILKSTLNGRKKRKLQLAVIGLLISCAIGGIFWLPPLWKVYETYGFAALNAPAYSMEHLFFVPSFISIGTYLVCMYIIRLLGIFMIMILCAIVTSKLKSFVISFTAVLGIVVVPICFALLGVNVCRYILFVPFLLGRFI